MKEAVLTSDHEFQLIAALLGMVEPAGEMVIRHEDRGRDNPNDRVHEQHRAKRREDHRPKRLARTADGIRCFIHNRVEQAERRNKVDHLRRVAQHGGIVDEEAHERYTNVMRSSAILPITITMTVVTSEAWYPRRTRSLLRAPKF